MSCRQRFSVGWTWREGSGSWKYNMYFPVDEVTRKIFVFWGKLYGAFLYCIPGKRGIIGKVEGWQMDLSSLFFFSIEAMKFSHQNKCFINYVSCRKWAVRNPDGTRQDSSSRVNKQVAVWPAPPSRPCRGIDHSPRTRAAPAPPYWLCWGNINNTSSNTAAPFHLHLPGPTLHPVTSALLMPKLHCHPSNVTPTLLHLQLRHLQLRGSSPQICTKGHQREIFVKSYLWGQRFLFYNIILSYVVEKRNGPPKFLGKYEENSYVKLFSVTH